MEKFEQGEKVEIIAHRENLAATYTIKDIKESLDGKLLYLLKPLDEESGLRLYYENDNSSLRRIDKEI